MSQTVAEIAPAQPTGLMAWLRFDESRVPEVEAAYDTYTFTARPGVFGFLAFIVGGIALVILPPFLVRVMPTAAAAGAALAIGNLLTYGIFLVAIARCPRGVLATMLRGCVDAKRACVFAALVAIPIAIVELLIIGLLDRTNGALQASHHSFPFVAATGALYAVTLAPVAEEFFFQGWLQTRLRGMGPFWSAVSTTMLFVIFHFSWRPGAFVRAIGLGFNAYLRGTTRSMAACIVAHAANNVFLLIIGEIVVLLGHRR